jgi:hypothetical protein
MSKTPLYCRRIMSKAHLYCRTLGRCVRLLASNPLRGLLEQEVHHAYDTGVPHS